MPSAIRVLLLSALLLSSPSRGQETLPLTPAEKSGFKTTARHAEVVAFCEALAKASPLLKLDTLGTSVEGRKIPVIILADPPIATAEEAGRSGKPVVLFTGNIHAGEVDGKEALLMLARELATAKDRKLLKELIVCMVPILNPDGNEKFGKTNRPGQNGPEEAGVRVNADGLDLNRDFVKLESPEIRSLVKFISRWDPAVFIDMHTTNGSYHRFAVTYDGPRHPASDSRLVAAARDTILPGISQRLEKMDGSKSFVYGNFSADRKRWETYGATPRFGIQYLALRNRISILCESYTYASFKDRIQASHHFALACLEQVAATKDTLKTLLTECRDATVRGGKKPREDDQVALRVRTVASKTPATILGFVEEEKDGKRITTDKPKDYPVEVINRCEATLSVARPFAYLFPASLKSVTEVLQRHGVDVEELREDIELDIEAYRIDKFSKNTRAFQKHNLATVEATSQKRTTMITSGTVIVRTGQPLGTLAAYLLEPQSEDGLVAWNFFDAALAEGKEFPVLRLPSPVPLTSGKIRPLAEERATKKKPITLEAFEAGQLPNFGGNPVAGLRWLDDGEHFLQTKERQLVKVHAATGRTSPWLDHDKLEKTLAGIPGVKRNEARTRARSPQLQMNPQKTACLIDQDGDLWHCPFDGGKAVRLTKTPAAEEEASFSPDGKYVAFVRGNNLFVVDVATQTERQLTKDGSDTIFNGKADWVYFEEIFNRNHHAYWWSPDSSRIAFLRFDDGPVKKFTVIDELPVRQKVEITAYPKAGDPNPTVKVGIAPVTSGDPVWVDLGKYDAKNTLVCRVGWRPDSSNVYCYVQDRAQTWLDLCTAGRDGGAPTVLFRDKTKAWLEDPGDLKFLKDGSFLLLSERTGFKHLYHYAADGKLVRPVTEGDWEIRQLHEVDEQGGWIYFNATKDSPIATNLYRVHLDGTQLTRLTKESGDHIVQVAEGGKFFVATWADRQTPGKVRLFRGDGTPVRWIDTNPVHAIDDYEFGPVEFVKIPTSDGFELEAIVVLPPNLDAKKKYPVWFKTYGGPHAPTIRDAWLGGRAEDHALARAGYIVFRADPRSASGKGAVSTWSAYKQLGILETKDVETAIKWLCQRPYVDASRIGMSGHSYGGFLTAYMMTHTKLFAAGIAGAPVTDWHNYDSIYTERYMNTPQANPEGYRKTSVVSAAKDLHGKLLIIHGIMDDNVHMQNSAQFIDELQKADKDFELMMYPRARHPIFGKHYHRLMLDFMKRNLKP